MASSLIPVTLAAPGFWGLNTQDSPTGLDQRFCLEASNCVIDQSGRIAARKGWERVFSSNEAILASTVYLVHEYINSAGTVELLVVIGDSVYTITASSSNTPVLIYTGLWGSANWKAVNFNGKCYLFQRGYTPLVYDGTTMQLMTTHGSYAGSVQSAHEVLAAYGRLWTADTTTDKYTIQWSDTLIGEAWTGGGSGSLDLRSVYPGNLRPVTALAAFNGKLVIFCDKVIIIYTGAAGDPSTNLTLEDTIYGVGCISRDSVINLGNDIVFLSDTGVRSLSRVLIQKSAPLNDVSKNVRDRLMQDVALNNSNDWVKSGYNELDGQYILSFPLLGKSWVFDLKQKLEDGSHRVTTWTIAPYSMCYRLNRDFLYGFAGTVGKASTLYTDDGAQYEMSYISSHLHGEDIAFESILKFLRLTGYGGSNYLIRFLWGTNYAGLSYQAQTRFPSKGTASEYNVSEYAIGEYGSDVTAIRTVRQNLSHYGRVFQIGIQVPIKNYPFSIQQVDVFTKKGRISTT